MQSTHRRGKRRLHRLLTRLSLTFALLAMPWALAAQQTLDAIVAVVNEDVILASELESEVERIMAQLRQRGGTPPQKGLIERQVLDRLIIQRLQLILARRAGISVDDATLNAAVRRVAEQNNMNLIEFRNALTQEGMSFDEFREALRDEILVSRVRQRHIEGQVQVSPQEIDEFLASQQDDGAEHLLGHILIATPRGADDEQKEEARARAEALVAELRAGADFAVAAASHSDSQTALDGGSLGWRRSGQLPTLFVDVVPPMNVGGISDPISSAGGFHIVKLQDRRHGDAELVTETRARHILIRTDVLVSDSDARQRLQTIKQRVESGADFGELARAHSADRGSAMDGGDLGWRAPGSFVPAFERVIDELTEGELSEPFQTQYGWHLVQVQDRRERDVSEEMRRMKAAEQIRERKIEEASEAWLRRLRDEAFIDIRLEQ